MRSRVAGRMTTALLAVFLAFGASHFAEAQVLKGVGKALRETGEAIGKGVDKTGEAIEKGVRETGDAIKGDRKQPATTIIEPAYLFVQQAGAFRFKDGKLTLQRLAPSTFYFTDRPVRDAGFVGHEEFVKLWSADQSDGFAADPPSAALAIDGLKSAEPMVVTLLEARLDGADIIYTVDVKSGTLPVEAKDVALFIDTLNFRPANGYRFLDFLARN
ncbi:hypothetical protein [Hoeflea poritis]|uniref:Outer membrane lipoprotein carrier protein LolA n=1 Tax=Hoeflea poritis TaxID=2993659 RepID=A0ABT4VVQ2_9HYPH|nr:hypothetical protein [Hoeflea poritis]MDA4848795.1 hypothetical protein [Hoeflea poritis]